MKKSTILSMMTALALTATSVATFAVWDTVEASTQHTVTLRNPVTISIGGSGTAEATQFEETLDAKTAELTGTVDFTVENTNDLAKSLTLAEVVKVEGGSVTLAETTDYTITFEESSGSGLSGKVDSDLTNTTYNYTITLNESGLGKVKSASNQQITIDITGTLAG